MPNGNPEFKGHDQCVLMYRGGVAGAWDKKGMLQGYLISKLMAEWLCEDKSSPSLMEATRRLPESSTVTIGENIYKKPLLLVESCAILGASMKSFAEQGDAHARSLHSISSSKISTHSPPIGSSAYVGMTPTLKVAISFCSPTELVWKFHICQSDLWKGGLEDEWLARGGTRIYNVHLSTDSGATFKAV